MPIFTIEKATTHAGRKRRAGAGRESRTLEIEGPGDGGLNRARFEFGAPEAAPAVGYLTRCGDDGVSLVGWLPARAYTAFRDALAAGGPLQVHYETREGEAGYLRRIGLGRAGATLAAAGRRPGRSTSPAFAMPH